MLQSKRGNLIISLILAITIWFYVVGEMNPTTNKTYRNIPITLINTQTLEKDGLAVVSTSDSEMSITITGKRSAVNDVRTADITATVDVSEAAEGDNQLRINISVPSNVEVKDQSLNRVTVNVQELVSAEKPVQILYSGKSGSGKEATTTSVDPETVTVSGAQSQVDKVSYVKGVVDVADIKTSETVISTRLTAVDSSGKTVKNVTLSQSKANVKTVLYYKKEVALKVSVTGADSGNVVRTYEAPSTIRIKGPKDTVESISTVTADEVDLSGVTKSTDITLNLNLPEGVVLTEESEDPVLSVTVKNGTSDTEEEKTTTKAFTLDGKDVKTSNLPDGLEAEITTESVKVKVSGTQSQLAKIEEDDIILTASCGNLDEGTHSVKVEASCNKTNAGVSVSPTHVTVLLSETGH